MLSQTLCYWDKQQSADSNVPQFLLTLKCTKDQSSHFCDCFLISKWIFQHHDRGLTKFHAGSEQLLVCTVIKNSIYPTVENNNTAYHTFVKYWMQARGFINNRWKYCWLKVIYCICQPKELKWEIKKKTGGSNGGLTKNQGDHGPPRSPLTIATVLIHASVKDDDDLQRQMKWLYCAAMAILWNHYIVQQTSSEAQAISALLQ